MPNFSLEEVELLLHIARDAAGGDTFEERLSAITDRLLALVPTTSLSAVVIPTGSAAPEHLFFRNNDPAALMEYAMHYRHVDPMRGAIERPTGVPVVLSDFISGRDFGREAFTGEFLHAHKLRHVLGVATRMPDGACLAIAMQRERGLGDFTRRERELMRLITPDLARAVFATLLRNKVQRMLARSELPDRPEKGFMTFDAAGDLVEADPGALAIFALLSGPLARFPGDVFVADVRRLAAAPVAEQQLLERTLNLPEGGQVRLRLQATRGASERVEVAGELEVSRPTTRSRFDALAEKFRLTPRERQVAALTVEGRGNRHIGFELGLSEITVGTHLTSIYRKTGVAGRTELVRLFMQ